MSQQGETVWQFVMKRGNTYSVSSLFYDFYSFFWDFFLALGAYTEIAIRLYEINFSSHG